MKLRVVLLLLLVVTVGRALVRRDDAGDQGDSNDVQSDDTTSTTTSTTSSATTAATAAQNGDADDQYLNLQPVTDDTQFDCSWPEAYEKRMGFCESKNQLESELTPKSTVVYGVLSRNIIRKIEKSCTEGQCAIDSITDEDIEDFTTFWNNHKDHILSFKDCLQKNTEALVKSCGSNTKIGLLLSGAAGLHLNLITILNEMIPPEVMQLMNASSLCWRNTVISVHFTAAVYVTTSSYQQNSVMCWNAGKTDCVDECGQLAAKLVCTGAACTNITQDIQKFTIWQWYFNDPVHVHDVCRVKPETCGSDDVDKKQSLFGNNQKKTLMDKVKHEAEVIKVSVEKTFHQPYYVVLAGFMGGLAVFVLIVSLCCMWHHGMICENKNRKIKYSSLLSTSEMNNSDEKRLLAGDDDFE